MQGLSKGQWRLLNGIYLNPEKYIHEQNAHKETWKMSQTISAHSQQLSFPLVRNLSSEGFSMRVFAESRYDWTSQNDIFGANYT